MEREMEPSFLGSGSLGDIVTKGTILPGHLCGMLALSKILSGSGIILISLFSQELYR